LIDNYSKEEVVSLDEDGKEQIKMYNLKENTDPRKVTIKYE
jgi:hypothetical protein